MKKIGMKEEKVTKATEPKLLYEFRYDPGKHEGVLYVTDTRTRAHGGLPEASFRNIAMDLGLRIDPECQRAFVVILNPLEHAYRTGGGNWGMTTNWWAKESA